MSRSLVILLVLAGCDQSPAHRSTPREGATAPASNQARALDAATVTAPAACEPRRLVVEPGRVVVRAPTGDRPIPWTDRDAAYRELAAALGPPAGGCDQVILEAADQVSYDDLVAVMDAAVSAGYPAVAIDDGTPDLPPGDAGADSPRVQPTPEQMRAAPVVIVTPTEIRIGDALVTADLTAPVAAATERVLRAGAAPRPHLILQADKTTPARVIREILVGARQAGYDNVLFAVKNR